MNVIKKRQEDIIEEFAMLDENLEMAVDYLIELGEELGSLPEKDKIEANIVKGCQSKVWITTSIKNNFLTFKADSNTSITKGLVSLLIRVFNQSTVKDILNTSIYFPKQIGMDRFIGTQRSNGFASMILQIKKNALILSEKT